MEQNNATQGESYQNENSALPKLYTYFGSPVSGQNFSGLTAEKDGFRLNEKLIRITSGALHYFRIHPFYWRVSLRKLRASGANTVETYVPWNLHEPLKNEFDFGQDPDKHDLSLFLDLRKFIQIAQEEDLLLILRPGPFICSEFEFGGLPSYLLRDPDMKVRTAYQPYLDRVKIYLDNLLPHVVDLQFTSGGPIIALQVENEYASFDTIDKAYLEFIQESYLSHGVDSLLFTSDGSYNGEKGSLPGLLKTANFQFNPESNLNDLLKFQPDKPPMVMEFWSGWFDHWFEPHSKTSLTDFVQVLDVILGGYNASVNFYMFHGGTNFGFTAGANNLSDAPFYAPDATSYDYDAPLTEAGDYTAKYYKILEMAIHSLPPLQRPPLPPQSRKMAYPPVQLQRYLTFSDILEQVPATSKFTRDEVTSMEKLDLNSGSGQSQGYILYRKRAKFPKGLASFRAGPVRDFGILLLDQEIQPFPRDDKGATKFWLNSVQQYELYLTGETQVIDLLIENMGRINFGAAKNFLQHKGLVGKSSDPRESYHLNEQEIRDVEVISLEFKSSWVKNLTHWRKYGENLVKAPVIVESTFTLAEIGDTFIDMSSWSKGILFVNGFNVGRYFNAGPQQTLYVPGPLLKIGENSITIFEQLSPGREIVFSSTPKLGPVLVKGTKVKGSPAEFLNDIPV